MPSPTNRASITPLPPLTPDLYDRAWCSVPHPTLPLLATAHAKTVTIFSLTSRTPHSRITNGHERSIRTVSWRPGLPSGELCLVTGSFDSTAGLWRWGEGGGSDEDEEEDGREDDLAVDVSKKLTVEGEDKDWQFTLVLEGHDSEIKSLAFSPSGTHLATSSRDKSIWIWEDVGDTESADEWETIAVLNEHEGDVKMVAWCPDVPGRNTRRSFSPEVLASASYDDTVRIWREDGDGEWVCVSVLEGHAGTVWGIAWEGREREDNAFPRLVTHSADGSIRIWKLREEGNDVEEGGGVVQGVRSGFGGIPNTMRRSVREEWVCEAVLPKVHDKDVYSVTWSARTGLLASTGSDGVLALYGEEESEPTGGAEEASGKPGDLPGPKNWKLLATVKNAHGPYEINHVTWCPRYDAGSQKKGVEGMLVTTGDDGLIRTWEVNVGP